ncbi:MAG: hypothetical protein R6U38_18140, partial [Desulfatiglandaceae bacterium]
EKFKNGELVEPKEQIIYYIDRATPQKWSSEPLNFEPILTWSTPSNTAHLTADRAIFVLLSGKPLSKAEGFTLRFP